MATLLLSSLQFANGRFQREPPFPYSPRNRVSWSPSAGRSWDIFSGLHFDWERSVPGTPEIHEGPYRSMPAKLIILCCKRHNAILCLLEHNHILCRKSHIANLCGLEHKVIEEI